LCEMSVEFLFLDTVLYPEGTAMSNGSVQLSNGRHYMLQQEWSEGEGK